MTEHFVIGDGLYAGVLKKYTGDARSVAVPEGVTELSGNAFGDYDHTCESLESISLPKSIKKISEHCFMHCPNLKSINVDENNEVYLSRDGILFDKCMETLIAFPAAYEGQCIVPDSVKTIAEYAFSNSRITSIEFPESLKAINANAFTNCALEEVFIPEKVSKIGSPGQNAFTSNRLKHITVDEHNKTFMAENDLLYSSKTKTLQFCPRGKEGVVQLRDGTNSISESAFAGCENITEIIIPDSVQKIGFHAFSGCTSIKRIKLPAKINMISFAAFSYCQSLYEVVLPEELDKIDEYAFSNCDSLKVIFIPEKTAIIKKNSFDEATVIICSQLLFSKLSKNQKTMAAMYYLDHSEEITGDSKTTLEAYIIKEKKNLLKEIVKDDDAGKLQQIHKITSLAGKEQEQLLKTALKEKKNMIAAALLEIGGKTAKEEAIENKPVKVANDKQWKKPKAGSTLIGRYVGNDTEIEFPAVCCGLTITGTADVSGSVPENYRNITKVTIPEGYISIGKKTFEGCEKLETVILPSTLKTIGSKAFSGCKSLKKINLPSAVQTIGSNVFEECSFEVLEIPESLSLLPKSCFDNAKIQTIVYRGKNLKSEGRIFDWGEEPTAFYTDAKVNIYNITNRVLKPLSQFDNPSEDIKKTEEEIEKEWKYTLLPDNTLRLDFYDGNDSVIEIPSVIKGKTVTEIGYGTFTNRKRISDKKRLNAKQSDVRSHIKKIIIPEGVQTIGEESFSECSVQSVIMSDTVTEIRGKAFENCKELKEIKFSSNLKVIGPAAFSGMHEIEVWNLPDGLERIEDAAFLYSSMSEIHIPESVSFIGKGILYNWGNGTDIIIFGKAGSKAEQYAKDNHLTFREV